MIFQLGVLVAQENKSLIGEWRVVSVDNGEVYLNVKTDSVSTTAEFDKKHKTKVSHQDGIAEIRAFSSKNEFIFSENGEFRVYMNSKRKTKYLDGNLSLNVKSRTGKEMQKELELEFINELLLVQFKFIAMRGNKPTEYLLERI
ncbi:hypothetical protein [Aquimarina sp. AD1]|uniref:hypothetical protein n=1 Tax=Aquimarina sp. (strain AD1) TaxID=1714848 RepID=UPI0011C38EC7|nr:hypothetical protein [Aquimarina sp. AD1]